MKYKQKYQEIIDELIKKSFPELSKAKAFELKFTKVYATYIPFFNLVGINKLCRKFPEKEIRGILVHELCHAELCKSYGFLRTFFLYATYWIMPSVRKKEEDKTDELVIRKGYVKDLILSTDRLGKEYPECKDKTYMSSEKVKAYAKRIGKW